MERNQSTLRTFDELASLYQAKYMDVSLYHDSLDAFCRQITTDHPRILEIACGPGNVTRYILARRPDFQLEGIDLAPNMVRLARENNPAARFTVMDAREIGALTGKFEGILCGFGLPYLSREEAEQLIRDCAGLLQPGGALYLSAMEDDYAKSGYETTSDGNYRTFIYYHQEDVLREKLEQNGFGVVGFKRQPFAKPDGTALTDIILISVKNGQSKI